MGPGRGHRLASAGHYALDREGHLLFCPVCLSSAELITRMQMTHDENCKNLNHLSWAKFK